MIYCQYIYINDILIATTDLDEHYRILNKLLNILVQYGIKLSKCRFLNKEIDYLSYVANEKGIRPNDYHIQTIKNYPMPTNVKDLQSCLGVFSYFRRFVHSFSKIAGPLLNLLKKETKFNFDKDCERAFFTLKDASVSRPILSIFNPKKETELHTDASASGFGAILMQKSDDNKWHPVSYFSKRTTAAESRYHSFELGTLAIIYALKRIHSYISGMPFTIITDCNVLSMTLAKKNIYARIARWALQLENYNHKVIHRKGESMKHVDALSRNFVIGALNEEEVDIHLQIKI